MGLGWGLVLVLAVSALFVGGCGKLLGPKEATVRAYPDGPAGLEEMWKDVLASSQRDDREQVHAIFQSLKMPRKDLDMLFGPRAADLAVAYDDMMASVIHKGAVDIVAVIYEKKYDRVQVFPMQFPDATVGEARGVHAEDIALARNLVAHPPLYSVRLKKGDDALGTRYDFFFYSDGHWRTGNQIGKIIAKRDGLVSPNVRPPVSQKNEGHTLTISAPAR